MRDFLRSRMFRLGALVVVLLGLYAWAGFWLAPRIIRSQAISFVRENYHRELQIGAVRVQPFWLQLEVRDLAFPDSDGQPMLALSGLALRAHGADADWIVVPGVELASIAVDMPAQSAAIGALTISGLKAKVWTQPDGSVNLKQLFAPDAAASPASPAAAATAASAGAHALAPKPWTLQLSHVDLNGAALDFEDRMQAPVKRFAFNPVNLHVEGASLDLAKPLPVRFDALINGHAPLKPVASTVILCDHGRFRGS